MISETNIFNCFLEVEKIYNFYSQIGFSLLYDRDIANVEYRGKALDNSIALLLGLNFIEKENGIYSKKTSATTYELFSQKLRDGIVTNYQNEIRGMVVGPKHYDEASGMFFLYVNDIPLKYMGLAMLLEQLGDFCRNKNKEYIIDERKYSRWLEEDDDKTISVDEFDKIQLLKRKLGEEAEEYIIDYERKRLKKEGINREPKHISKIDVSAGYDIASYTEEGVHPNRFIEVKSCDSSYSFYLSRNEIETAKIKDNAYYLYLYNRTNDEVIMIQNPYLVIFSNESEWMHEPSSYRITKEGEK